MLFEISFSTLHLHPLDQESETVIKAEPVYQKFFYQFNLKDIKRRKVSAGFLRRKVLRTMKISLEKERFLTDFVWHLN